MIEREEIRFIAAADWTDDCRVRVELRKRVTTLTIAEAKALRSELDTAIAEASAGAEQLLRPVETASFDVAILSPDCGAGNKHRACIGTAWDMSRDEVTNCTCECHAKEGAA